VTDVKLPSRKLAPAFVDLLKALKPGDNITITQTVRVGSRTWTTSTPGVYRGVNYLATGITVDRIAADDVVVPTVHYTKPNGELTSAAIDENTAIVRS
jgi:hypothetical protein